MDQSVAHRRFGQLDIAVGENPSRERSRARLRSHTGYVTKLKVIISKPISIREQRGEKTYLVVLRVESRLGVKEIGKTAAKSTGQNQQFFPPGCG